MKTFVQCAGCRECIKECIRGAIVKRENGVEIAGEVYGDEAHKEGQ